MLPDSFVTYVPDYSNARVARMQSSQSEVLARVRLMIAAHAKHPHSEIRDNTIVWDLFPPSQGPYEEPSVTEFVRAVHREFSVFLTEDEWERPSVSALAALVARKADSPEASAADRASERRVRQKGTLFSLAIFTVVGALTFFVAEGSERRRFSLALGITLFSWLIVGFISFVESRRGDQRA